MKNDNNILYLLMCLAILAFGIMIGRVIPKENNQVSFPSLVEVGLGTESASTTFLKKEFGDEYEIIMAAALRNHCDGDNLLILFAIRKEENGPPGNEFGIKCPRHINTNLDGQAGCAAYTIMKNRIRWEADEGYDELFGVKGFIFFLGNRYCPDDSVNWIHNVNFWYDKFREKTQTQE